MYDARNGASCASLRGTKESTSILNVSFSYDDTMLLATGNDFIGRVWSLKTSRVIHTLVGHTSKVPAAAFTRDGEKAITGSYDRSLKIWSVDTARAVDQACLITV